MYDRQFPFATPFFPRNDSPYKRVKCLQPTQELRGYTSEEIWVWGSDRGLRFLEAHKPDLVMLKLESRQWRYAQPLNDSGEGLIREVDAGLSHRSDSNRRGAALYDVFYRAQKELGYGVVLEEGLKPNFDAGEDRYGLATLISPSVFAAAKL